MDTHIVFLGLGANLGDREANLKAAVDEINKRVGEVTSLSAFYVTEPWGIDSPHAFLNAVCSVETILSPHEILVVTQDIERMVGRTKKTVNGCYSDRLIDIDILIYDDCRLNTPELTIPHPLMHKRDFVMKPLEEIAPDLVKSMFADWSAEHSSLADR